MIIHEIEDIVNPNGQLLYQQPAYDKIINPKVLPQKETMYRLLEYVNDPLVQMRSQLIGIIIISV